MEDLNGYRLEIDEIDAQLIPLFERRMNVVRKVARYKKAHNLPVLQAGREQVVLEKATARLQEPCYAPEAARFMNAVMEISRAAQSRDLAVAAGGGRALSRTGRVGYPGVAGSFSEQAAIDYFGAEQAREAYTEFEDVCEALKHGAVDYGVLPIENSSTGAVSAVYDLLDRYGFSIVGEHRLRVVQNLVGAEGASIETVRTVFSHEQGIEQSSRFLSSHKDWQLVPFHNTAVSAKHVAELNDPANAAIASRCAAELYGLRVLAPDIQNSRHNVTRFVVIGREQETRGADKVSLVFTLDNASGTLYRTLQYFAERRINLVKIESRPIPEVLWNYRFYLDFEGDLVSGDVREALDSIARDAKDFRVLGAYRSDRNP